MFWWLTSANAVSLGAKYRLRLRCLSVASLPSIPIFILHGYGRPLELLQKSWLFSYPLAPSHTLLWFLTSRARDRDQIVPSKPVKEPPAVERLLRLLTPLGRNVEIVIREPRSQRPGRLTVRA